MADDTVLFPELPARSPGDPLDSTVTVTLRSLRFAIAEAAGDDRPVGDIQRIAAWLEQQDQTPNAVPVPAVQHAVCDAAITWYRQQIADLQGENAMLRAQLKEAGR